MIITTSVQIKSVLQSLSLLCIWDTLAAQQLRRANNLHFKKWEGQPYFNAQLKKKLTVSKTLALTRYIRQT